MSFLACVWDLDGTLIHTLPTIHHYCNRSLEHFGLSPITLADCQKLCKFPIQHFYHQLLKLGGCPNEEIPRLHDQIRDYDCTIYFNNFIYLTQPYRLIPSVLNDLHDKGIRHAVLTNKPDKIAAALTTHFFGSLIDICIGQTPDSFSKPDFRSMNPIIDQLQLPRTKILYIGDTDIDIQTARNAGISSAAVTWGYQDEASLLACCPDFLIRNPNDLIPLF